MYIYIYEFKQIYSYHSAQNKTPNGPKNQIQRGKWTVALNSLAQEKIEQNTISTGTKIINGTS